MDGRISLDCSFERSAFELFLEAANTHTTRSYHICLQSMTSLYEDFKHFYACSTIRVETGSKTVSLYLHSKHRSKSKSVSIQGAGSTC